MPANAWWKSRKSIAFESRPCGEEQTVTVASSDFVLQEGDEVNAVVAPDAIGDFAQRFRSTPLQPKVTA